MGGGASKEGQDAINKKLESISAELAVIREQQHKQQRQVPHATPLDGTNGVGPAATAPNPLEPRAPRELRDGKPRPKVAVAEEPSGGDGGGLGRPDASTSPIPAAGSGGDKKERASRSPGMHATIVPLSESSAEQQGSDRALPVAAAGSTEALSAAGKKQKLAEVKAKQKTFFAPYDFSGPWNEIPKTPTVKCVWLGCAALGLAYVSGVAVKIDDVLRRNGLALHYLGFPSVTLAELHDIVSEFVASDPAMKAVRVEMASFDGSTLDDAGEELGTGDRSPVVSLSVFRKELTASLHDVGSVYIFNFDPYVVQEGEIPINASGKEDEDEDEEGTGGKAPPPPQQWAAKNMGQFAVLRLYNPALSTVTLSTPHVGPDGSIRLEDHVCPLQVLYNACCVRDGYTRRPRGLLRIHALTPADHEPVPSLFAIDVLDGRSAKGMLSVALDISISSHLLGLGLLHHLVASTLLSPSQISGSAGGGGGQLTGINVTDICRVLRLPTFTIVCPSRRDALLQAGVWYMRYLESLKLSNACFVGVVPVTRRDDAEDGAPSLMDADFFAHVVDCVKHRAIMMVNFNINVAQNVRVSESDEDASHFAIVVGVDEHRGIVKLADVSVKKFGKTWHIPLVRLYSAVLRYGFLVVTTNKALAEKHGGLSHAASLCSVAKYRPPPIADVPFEYPRKNYSVTTVASSLSSLGFPTTVEDLVYQSGFHISFVLSEHVPMHDVTRVVDFYVAHKFPGKVRCVATNADEATIADLRTTVKTCLALPQEQRLIVCFGAAPIQKRSDVWNGSAGGPMAQVLAFDEKRDVVTLSDSNPDPYYRHWDCPMELLFLACSDTDRITDRGRGWIQLLVAKPDDLNNATTPMVSSRFDARHAMVHHPFKPPISAPASALAIAFSELLGQPISLEEVVYRSPSFSLTSFASQALTTDDVVALATTFATSQNSGKRVTIARGDHPKSAQELAVTIGKAGTVAVVIYAVPTVLGARAGKGKGAGLVCQVGRDNSVTVCDGNPTKVGAYWSRSFDVLFPASDLVLLSLVA